MNVYFISVNKYSNLEFDYWSVGLMIKFVEILEKFWISLY